MLARAWPYKSFNENALVLKKNLLLFSQALISDRLIYKNDEQGRVYQNCKVHDPWGRVLMLGRGHKNNYSEYVLSSTLSIFFTLN